MTILVSVRPVSSTTTLEVRVGAEDLRKRRQNWRAPALPTGTGFLAKYARLVGPASKGALVGATDPA